MITNNPYTVLGLTQQASATDIKKAYFTLVRQYPPERDSVNFQRIRSAYDALRTVETRAATDRQLVQAPPPYLPPKRLPMPDLTFHPEDRWLIARRHGDLERTDFHTDFRAIPDLRDSSI